MPKRQTHGNVARLDRVCGIKEKAVNGGSTKLRAGYTNGLRIGGWILDREAFRRGDGQQSGVGANEDGHREASSEIVVSPRERARQLHRVVCPQGMFAAKRCGACEDGAIDLHDDILAAELLLKASDESITVPDAEARGRLTCHTAQACYDLYQCCL